MKNSNSAGVVNFYNPDDTKILLSESARGESTEVSLTLRFQTVMEAAIDDLSNIGTKLSGRSLIATGTDRDGNAFQITLNVNKDAKTFMPTGGKEVALGELVPELPTGGKS